jgi:protein-L-isoaspartate(D-aspartate) O-methyltransferase
MTGQAESQRKVKPDPANPQLFNGSFEETTRNGEGHDEPAGWHYQRQLTSKSDAGAPDGKRFVTFENAEPGRGCHALQGFAVNGRAISSLDLHYWVRGKNIRPGSKPEDLPRIVVTFYDERRATVGEEATGQFNGTFAWQEETGRIRVPLKAREAIIRIGLLGATGELSLDGLRLSPTVAP